MWLNVPRRTWQFSKILAVVAVLFGAALATEASAQNTRMTEDEFRQILALLDSTDPTARIAAADAIGTRGARYRRDASAKLRHLLANDPDVRVRASSGRAIGRLGLRDALPELIQALADRESSVRIVAAAALWRLPDSTAVPALIVGLRDEDPTVREWCALAVGVTEDPRAAEPLAQALSDSAGNVRLEAVRSLARIGDPVAMPALVARVQDDDESMETRLEAVNALASVQSPDKSNALVRLLDEDNQEIRLQVVRALGQVGDALVIPPLRRLAGRPGNQRIGAAIREAIAAIEARASQPAAPPAAPQAPATVSPG